MHYKIKFEDGEYVIYFNDHGRWIPLVAYASLAEAVTAVVSKEDELQRSPQYIEEAEEMGLI